MIRYSWTIALLPFVSFLLTMLFGKRLPGKGAWIGILAVGAGVAMSLSVLWHFVSGGVPFESSVHWFTTARSLIAGVNSRAFASKYSCIEAW